MKALSEECFSIGYTTIRNFVNSEEKRMKEVFIFQDPAVGRKIEFDWGEEKLFRWKFKKLLISRTHIGL